MKTDEKIFSEVELNMKQRQTNARVVTRVIVDLMDDHLMKPA
jgi:hypothetical protein